MEILRTRRARTGRPRRGAWSHFPEGAGHEHLSSQIARQLAAKPASALRTTKRLMRRDPEPLSERVNFELEEFGRALQSPEAAEAISALMEKREPDFSKFD